MEKQEQKNKGSRKERKERLKKWFSDHKLEIGMGIVALSSLACGMWLGETDGYQNGLTDGYDEHFRQMPALIDTAGKKGYFATRDVVADMDPHLFDKLVDEVGGEAAFGRKVSDRFYSDESVSRYLDACDEVSKCRR